MGRQPVGRSERGGPCRTSHCSGPRGPTRRARESASPAPAATEFGRYAAKALSSSYKVSDEGIPQCTFVDLQDYRRAAADAIHRLGHQVITMEVFGARPEEPRGA